VIGKETWRIRATAGRRERAGADLTAALAPLLESAKGVASFVPMPDEPGVPPRAGWLLPVLLPDGDLDWAEHDGELVPGRYGVLEPTGRRLGVDAVAGCDVVLVPALLVDREGVRLGKGGGSYDRALTRAAGLTVALVHDDELVDTLPCEPHDVRVGAVATPSGGVLRLPAKMSP
jgi:5-formyltetrahydrofolate cyclo-ligase